MMMQHTNINQSRYLLDVDFGERLEEHQKRIIIGSISRRLDEPHARRWTHQFRVYVKLAPAANYDTEEQDDGEMAEWEEWQDELQLGDFVQKVVFRFSDECANCISIVDGPPFQSNSYCNRDLNVTLTLLFRDVNHSCTIFHHQLKLRAIDSHGREQPCVLSEHIETIRFVNPSRRMMKLLKLKAKSQKEKDEQSNGKSPSDARFQKDLKRARKMVNRQRKYLVNSRHQFFDF